VIDEKRHFVAEISSRCFRVLHPRCSSLSLSLSLSRQLSGLHWVTQGLTKFNSAEFYLPIGRYMSEVHKVPAADSRGPPTAASVTEAFPPLLAPVWQASEKGWDEAVTCRATITFRELLDLIGSRKAHRLVALQQN
jgi:hypothetical protein